MSESDRTIADIRARVERYKQLEAELMKAGLARAARLSEQQTNIEENYYGDVMTLLETIDVAIYELEKLEELLEMPERGYVRNGYNGVLRTLREGF